MENIGSIGEYPPQTPPPPPQVKTLSSNLRRNLFTVVTFGCLKPWRT